ncbi:MAG: carboxypeptidase-like regulatory domain-containing protein, partial [Bacteroidales bacterium]|nr:carboxypeptidase-like regulatory domain-containing protein [Bacteroidales bacterium]
MRSLLFIVLIAFIMPSQILAGGDEADKNKRTISGHIKDAKTGEDLIGATVYVSELATGAVTNVYGFYSVRMDMGLYTLRFSYIGYETIEKTIELKDNLTLDIELSPKGELLREVEIIAEAPDRNVKEAEMSVVRLDSKTIRQIPSLMGEVDIIKALLLMPGLQTAAEGSSGFVVRGGGPDQNLVILDEATVYNAGHLLGFFSV